MASTRKWRNVVANGKIAIVVDDLVALDPWEVRLLEVRGTAEAVQTGSGIGDGALLRIRPSRILSFGVDSGQPGRHNRDV